MTEESLEMVSVNEDMKISNESRYKSEKSEEIHEDSDIFNDAIKKSNKEGDHELIYDLLRPGSSLSIITFTQFNFI